MGVCSSMGLDLSGQQLAVFQQSSAHEQSEQHRTVWGSNGESVNERKQNEDAACGEKKKGI